MKPSRIWLLYYVIFTILAVGGLVYIGIVFEGSTGMFLSSLSGVFMGLAACSLAIMVDEKRIEEGKKK